MSASTQGLNRSSFVPHLVLLCLSSMALGAWELAITRVASVLFFYDVAYVVLAMCLFGIGVGALFAGRLPYWCSTQRMFVVLLASMPIAYLCLYLSVWAWVVGLFAVPFIVFGALTTKVWREIPELNERSRLYGAELLGALFGLLLLGPLVLTLLPINVLGEWGVQTHLKLTVAREGLVHHEHATNSAARTDLIETERANVRYIFTDGMFVTRSVAWDGESPTFDDPYIEELSRLKRLAFRMGENQQVALMGAGAGFDVAIALAEGAAHVTAIEVNPDTIDFARGYDEWAGGVLNHESVDVVVSEARRYMQASPARWDHINLTLLQTSSASLRGVQHVDARVLSIEAVQLYLSRLSDHGVVTIIQNTAALAAATEAVLEAVINADQNRLLRFKVPADEVTDNPFAYLFVLSGQSFSKSQIEQAQEQAMQLGVESVRRFSSANIAPATDDRPFLFLTDIRVSLQAGFILAFALLVVGMGLLSLSKNSVAQALSLASVFSGASAMTVQVIAIYWCQSAIGNPVLAIAVALSAVLAGSGIGVAAFGPGLTPTNGWRSGVVAGAAIVLLLMVLPGISKLAMAFSVSLASVILWVPLAICSLPLGLPFVSLMQYSRRVDHGEGLIVGFDGFGALLGVAAATLITLMLGYTSLGFAVVMGFLVFAVIARILTRMVTT